MTANNRLVIASAGAGKTTYLVHRALELADETVLITTYTEANEAEIRSMFHRKNGCIPPNVRIQTWFSFLIQHGVRPYQWPLLENRVRGLVMVHTASVRGVGEANAPAYYMTKSGQIYSDKLAKLVLRCNATTNGRVLNRISSIFSHIFVDEVQDLAGYDLDIIKLFFHCGSSVLLVGDPRQVTYLTHHEARYKKYREGRIREFVQNECGGLGVLVDETTLSRSFRCNAAICGLADRLYPGLPRTESAQSEVTSHDGVFVITKGDTLSYIKKYNPTQLTLNRNSWCACPDTSRMNYGQAKGRTLSRVLIYPTADMARWIFDHNTPLKPKTRAQFYVALTRAKHSVAVVSDIRNPVPEGVSLWAAKAP